MRQETVMKVRPIGVLGGVLGVGRRGTVRKQQFWVLQTWKDSPSSLSEPRAAAASRTQEVLIGSF